MPPTGDDDHIDRIRYRCAVRSGHDKETMPWQQPSPRSRPPAFPICRRWRGSNWRPPPPASAMAAAPTCCWPCSSRARAWLASSHGRNVRPPRSIGAARILRAARRARSWSIPATPMPSLANPAARRPSSPRISPRVLQGLLKQGVADSFNAVTIDGDTSTSDTLLAFATGAAAARGVSKIATVSDPRLPALRKAFDAVLANLAEQIARDGEGARKLVEIIVEGAVSKSSARKIALSIANSPLVKTAIAGEDANWGRVVMAVGKAGERADRDRLSIWFGGIRVAHRGERDPSYDEAAVSATMKKPEITLKVALGLGRGRDRVLTCDLTKEYVAINGDYRS